MLCPTLFFLSSPLVVGFANPAFFLEVEVKEVPRRLSLEVPHPPARLI